MRSKSLILVLFMCMSISNAYAKKLYGKVRDSHKRPLPFSTISINNGQHGAISDKDGNFAVNNLKQGVYSISVSYVGFNTLNKTITIEDKDLNLNFTLKESDTNIDEISISADRYAQEVKMQSIAAVKVNQEFISKNASGSLMQTLSKIAGISSIDMGSSASKPIIRGMSFNRVATINNGIKLEGQQWGETHGLEIDQYAVENIKVVKGPASIIYGSDAVAGVIEILPPSIPSKGQTYGDVKLIGKTNNDFVGTSVNLKSRKDKFFYTLRGTYLNFGDMRVPMDSTEYNSYVLQINKRLKNTAGREYAFHSNFGYLFNKGQTNFELSNLYRKAGLYADAFGVELRTQLPVDHNKSRRDIQIPNQEVNHFRISNRTHYTWGGNKIETNIGYQHNIHNDYDHLTDITGKVEIPDDHLSTGLKLETFSLKADYHLKYKGGKLKTGIDAQYIINSIDGFNFSIPAYNKWTSGAFVYNHMQIATDVYFDAGLRYDMGGIDVKEYVNPKYQNKTDSILSQPLQRNFDSFTGIMGVSAQLTPSIHTKINAGKSFRFPSIRELCANGMIWSSARYEIGNSNLKPEEAYQLDLEVTIERPWLNLTASGFYSFFSNYIFPMPTGDFNNIVGAGQVYNYEEAEAIRLGGELVMEIKPYEWIELISVTEYVFAQNKDVKMPLPFTPPLSTDNSATYKFTKGSIANYKLELSAGVKYLAKQDRVVQNEVPHSFTEAATIAYGSISSHLGRRKHSPLLNMRIDNIFNTQYFVHQSIYRRINLAEAGRNIQCTLTVPF